MSCEFALNDGAYVLGALAPAERAEYEWHLAGCPGCREAVASIAVLPGLLSRLAPLPAQEALPSAIDRLPKLVATVGRQRARQRRRRRWQAAVTALSAAGLVLAVTVGTGVLRPSATPIMLPSVPPTPSMTAMHRVLAETAVSAEVGLRETVAGVEVTMHCAYPPTSTHKKPYTFRLFALGSDGMAEQLGSWMAGPGENVTMTGMSRYHLADLVRLELRARDGTTLLAYDL